MIPTKFKRVFVFKTFTWNWRRGMCSTSYRGTCIDWVCPPPGNPVITRIIHKTFTCHWHLYSIGLYTREVIPLPLQISAIHLTIDTESPTTPRPPQKRKDPLFWKTTHWHSQTLSYQHGFGLVFRVLLVNIPTRWAPTTYQMELYITPISRLKSTSTRYFLGHVSRLCHS